MVTSLGALGAIYGLLGVTTVVIVVLWTILPFAVFGVKYRLDQIIKLQKNNEIFKLKDKP